MKKKPAPGEGAGLAGGKENGNSGHIDRPAQPAQVREKLAERIRKLLALSSNNPSEAEAAAALERASALMAEHNLTMAQVDALGTGDERVEDTHRSEHARQTWARLIWAEVAELNFCFWCYRSPHRSKGLRRMPDGRLEVVPPRETDEHILVGTKANIITTKLMAVYLVETVERLAREAPGLYGAHDHHAFKLGCARRLSQRLRELRQQRMKGAKKDAPPGNKNLPTLVDVYRAHEAANEQLYLKIHGRMPCGGSWLGTSRASAYAQGHRAGGGIGLNAQVGRSRSTLALPGGRR
jgi:Protein of unknown function (DUF2786)